MAIRVRLTNRLAYLPADLDEETRKKLRDYWSFAPKGVWMMPKFKATMIARSQRAVTLKQIEELSKVQTLRNRQRVAVLTELVTGLEAKLKGMWDGKIGLMYGRTVSAGLFRATWREVEQKCGVKFSVSKERATVDFGPGLPAVDEKFRHQNECVAAMIKTIPRGGGLILAATSSGKTAISAQLFAKVRGECLFIVDQLDLLYQQRKELSAWLHEPVGIVGEGEFSLERVTVATIQTLNLHRQQPAFKKWFADIVVMVVDELHEALANRDFNVLDSIKPVANFGLTATLQLKQKEVRMKAYAFAGPTIFEFPIATGVARGVLTKGSVLQLLFEPDVAPQAQTDYQTELHAQVLENELKIACADRIARELVAMDRHVVVMVDRLQQLHDMDDVLKSVPHRLAYGAIKVAERQEARDLFEDDDIKLLIANKVMKKGVSVKRIDAIIDMAEGKSKNDAIQKFGRGLRLHEGKDNLAYIDFGTSGHGRFARNAGSRRRAFKQIGISVTVAHVKSELQAVAALRKFIKGLR